jgi:hypothetical protein
MTIPLKDPAKPDKSAGTITIVLSIEEMDIPQQHWERKQFENMCVQKGELRIARQGQEILPFAYCEPSLYYIEKGMVQVRCPLSAVCCPLSAVCCPLSAVRCPLSAVRCPLFACYLVLRLLA